MRESAIGLFEKAMNNVTSEIEGTVEDQPYLCESQIRREAFLAEIVYQLCEIRESLDKNS